MTNPFYLKNLQINSHALEFYVEFHFPTNKSNLFTIRQ